MTRMLAVLGLIAVVVVGVAGCSSWPWGKEERPPSHTFTPAQLWQPTPSDQPPAVIGPSMAQATAEGVPSR